MKLCTTLATSLALALALPAFAQQDTTPPTDQAPPADQASPSGSTDSMANDSAPAPHHRHHRRAPSPAQSSDNVGGADSTPSNSPDYNANTARLTGNEPKVVAYQHSNRQKHYPAVDHGHVAGDPPVIDHSGDQAEVATPTHTTITVPPSGQP